MSKRILGLAGSISAFAALIFLGWLVLRPPQIHPRVINSSRTPAAANTDNAEGLASGDVRAPIVLSGNPRDDPGGAIRIVVRNDLGDPVSSAIVLDAMIGISRLPAESDIIAITDSAGVARLRLDEVHPEGLVVAHNNYVPAHLPLSYLVESDPVVVLERGAELRVRAQTRGGVPLEGVVVAASNRPFSQMEFHQFVRDGFEVASLCSGGLRGSRIAIARTDRDGYAALQGLRPGQYVYSAFHEELLLVGTEMPTRLPGEGSIVFSRPLVALAKANDKRDIGWWTGKCEDGFANTGMSQATASKFHQQLRLVFPDSVISVIVEPVNGLSHTPTLKIQCIGRQGQWNASIPYRIYRHDIKPQKISPPPESRADVGTVVLQFVDPSGNPWKPEAEHPFMVLPIKTRDWRRDTIVMPLNKPFWLLPGEYEIDSLSPVAKTALPLSAARRFTVKPAGEHKVTIVLRRHLAPVSIKVSDEMGIAQECGGIAIIGDTGRRTVRLFNGSMDAAVFWIAEGAAVIDVEADQCSKTSGTIVVSDSKARSVLLGCKRLE